MGVERITMLKYQIKDIRLLSENDTADFWSNLRLPNKSYKLKLSPQLQVREALGLLK